jgi:hypothetical protein
MTKDRANDSARKVDASRAKPFGPEHADTVKRVVGNLIDPDTLISPSSQGRDRPKVCGHCNKPMGDSIHMNILGKHIVSDRIA